MKLGELIEALGGELLAGKSGVCGSRREFGPFSAALRRLCLRKMRPLANKRLRVQRGDCSSRAQETGRETLRDCCEVGESAWVDSNVIPDAM